MFSFLNFSKERFPLLNVRALDTWLAQQPVNNVLALQDEVVGLLKALLTFQRAPDQNRLEAVFALDERLSELRTTLIAQYVASARANTALEARLWAAAYDLVVAFINAYEFLLNEAPRHFSDRKWDQVLPALLGRLIYYRGLDAKFRLFRHETWIPGRWHELHHNYAYASARSVETLPMPLANVEPMSRGVSIEQQYLHVLLLQVTNTGNVRPPQVEWMATQLMQWGKDLALTMQPKAREGFYVDLTSSEGLQRRRESLQGGQFLYLDTTVLHTRMLQHALAIKDQVDAASADRRRGLEEQLDALGKLAPCYAPVFKPFERSADRAQDESHSRVLFGFKTICKTLADIEEGKSLSEKTSESYSYSETAAMYVYGFLSEEVSKRREREKKLFAPPVKRYGEPAQIQDRSSTGCRLLVAANLVGPSELGTLIAMREDDDKPWSVGIVRRIRKVTADQVEVGVQLIAPAVARVTLRSQHRARENLSGYTVNGVNAVAHGDRVDGLCLEPVNSEQTSGMSVILPTAEYRSAQQMTLQDGPEGFNIMLRQAHERQPEWTWASADVLGGALD